MKRSNNQGFSLVELAIVLVIFALLAGGLMMTLTTQQEIQRLSEVRRQLADIREALLGFAVAHGRLPRPAVAGQASGTPNAGLESSDLEMGVLPWATLGLPETDPWGQRFTYRVSASFSSASTPALPGFKLEDKGNINVMDGTVDIAKELPAIVVSHGRNGLGGYSRNGLPRAGATGDELKNASDTKEFVSRTQSPDFDDEVIWIPLPILMNRMVTAGRLP